jgi:hypothetical protein
MESPGEITLAAVGPLTNLALAVSLEPRIAENVRGVVIMGGVVTELGNASPVAEANIHNDPEAAKIVFHAGWPLTMVGLDVTRKVVMTPDYLARLAEAGTPISDPVRDPEGVRRCGDRRWTEQRVDNGRLAGVVGAAGQCQRLPGCRYATALEYVPRVCGQDRGLSRYRLIEFCATIE